MKIHCIKTKKFKDCLINFVFKNKLVKSKITENSMLIDNMVYSTKNYPTKKELYNRLEYLYDAYISGRLTRTGENMYSVFSLSFLNPTYCDKGYIEDILDIMLEIIYNPNIEDDKFNEKNFNINKNNYRDYLESLKENSNKYAYRKSMECLNTPYISYAMDGYIEDFDRIDNKSLVNTYKELLNGELEIYVVGHLDMKYIEDYLNKRIKDNNIVRDNTIYCRIDNDKLIDIEEIGNNRQDNMLLHYSIDKMNKREREIVLPLYNHILGGRGLTSKLYSSVREKHSLCYYIMSFYNIYDSLLTIGLGFNCKNKDRCIELIDNAFNEMSSGKFTNKEVKDGIKFLVNQYKNSDNNVHSILLYNFNKDNYDTYLPNEKINNIKTVTKKEIVDFSKKIHLKEIFLLKGDEADENN